MWNSASLWLSLWAVLGCSAASAADCPVTGRGGRVVCLQAQLCSPGQPLAGPGCGPRRSHVCCLKGGAAVDQRPGPAFDPRPRPPPPPPAGPPKPWRPQPPLPWRPGHPEPWRPQPPQPWGPHQPNTLGPTASWQSDQVEPVSPTPPPLPSVALPPPVPPSAEPLLQCGREQPVFSRRRRSHNGLLGVTGGQDASRQRWPWAALLGERDNSAGGGGRRWFCGAALISRRALLTAAHCVTGMDPARLLVRLGEYDLSTSSDGPTEDLVPSELLVHPEYPTGRHRGPLHDLAVVRLRRPAALGRHVQPVCLPPAAASLDPLTGQSVSLAGWGLTEFAGTQADVLQEAELHVVAPESCEDAYRQLPTFRADFPHGFDDSVLCATGGGDDDESARDACNGDSGGPLVRHRADGAYQLVGLVSAGVGCGNPAFPGLYTRVSAHIDWILQNI